MVSDITTPPLRGRMAPIGDGRALHAIFGGPVDSPYPLVLLEAGAFGFSADWAAVQDALGAANYRSLAYDRAGLGRSDPGAAPRDGLAIVADLERLLVVTGEVGPLIVCGHSMAGLHTRLFARRNPARIVGLVLVDAVTPEAMDSNLISVGIGQFGHVARAFAWGAGTGLFKPLAATALGDQIGLTGAAKEEKRWAFGDTEHNRWAAEEVTQWSETSREAREAGVLDPDWPVAVILAGAAESANPLKALQVAPARASRAGSIEYVAGASHATMLNATYAPAIVRGVEHVCAAAHSALI